MQSERSREPFAGGHHTRRTAKRSPSLKKHYVLHCRGSSCCVLPYPRGTPKRWAEPTAMSTPKSPGGLSIVNDIRSVAATTSVSDLGCSHAAGKGTEGKGKEGSGHHTEGCHQERMREGLHQQLHTRGLVCVSPRQKRTTHATEKTREGTVRSSIPPPQTPKKHFQPSLRSFSVVAVTKRLPHPTPHTPRPPAVLELAWLHTPCV